MYITKVKCGLCGHEITINNFEMGDSPTKELMADKPMFEALKNKFWTTDPPTKEGWYWVYSKEHLPFNPQIILFKWGNFWINGADHKSDPNQYDYWLGPIPEPEAPK